MGRVDEVADMVVGSHIYGGVQPLMGIQRHQFASKVTQQLPERVRETVWVDVRADAHLLAATATFYRLEDVEKYRPGEEPRDLAILKCKLEDTVVGGKTVPAKIPDNVLAQICLVA